LEEGAEVEEVEGEVEGEVEVELWRLLLLLLLPTTLFPYLP